MAYHAPHNVRVLRRETRLGSCRCATAPSRSARPFGRTPPTADPPTGLYPPTRADPRSASVDPFCPASINPVECGQHVHFALRAHSRGSLARSRPGPQIGGADVRNGSVPRLWVARVSRPPQSPANAEGIYRRDLLRPKMGRHPAGDLTARPLDKTTWPDFARLVEKHNGVWGGCWCIAFHPPEDKGKTADQRRLAKLRLVSEGRAHAAPVYDGDQAIGWCQFGSPAELPGIKNRRKYEATQSARPDWRITCFFVDRDRRGEGVTRVALRGALREIARNGGGMVEGYPEPDQPRLFVQWNDLDVRARGVPAYSLYRNAHVGGDEDCAEVS